MRRLGPGPGRRPPLRPGPPFEAVLLSATQRVTTRNRPIPDNGGTGRPWCLPPESPSLSGLNLRLTPAWTEPGQPAQPSSAHGSSSQISSRFCWTTAGGRPGATRPACRDSSGTTRPPRRVTTVISMSRLTSLASGGLPVSGESLAGSSATITRQQSPTVYAQVRCHMSVTVNDSQSRRTRSPTTLPPQRLPSTDTTWQEAGSSGTSLTTVALHSSSMTSSRSGHGA